MQVEIRITGPAGCGKTRLANILANTVKARIGTDRLVNPDAEVHVVTDTTNMSRPKGIDTRPTTAWNREHEFDA